jgi:hypothetical protein
MRIAAVFCNKWNTAAPKKDGAREIVAVFSLNLTRCSAARPSLVASDVTRDRQFGSLSAAVAVPRTGVVNHSSDAQYRPVLLAYLFG